jgi:hypothetical protein
MLVDNLLPELGPSIDHSHQKINSIESVVSDQKIFKD